MTPPHGPRVLCAGLVTLDIIQTVDQLPRSNVKQRALGLSVDFGGPAASACGVAAGLGAAEARLLTAIGHGPVAEAVKTYLRRAGVVAVDLAGREVEEAFGASTVLVEQDSGDRAVVSTNAADVPLLLDAVEIGQADVVLLDGHRMELCLAVARAARAAGKPVVLDGGSWKPGTAELLRLVDVAVVSEDFVAPDESLAALMRRCGVYAFGQSLGHRSWTLDVAGQRHVIDVVEVPSGEMVDTVGAGDVLHGALAFAIGQWGLDRVVDACRFASEKASDSCRGMGARGWLAGPSGRKEPGLTF
ncbi:PfkB family carbohydrate kinase [Granulicoccus sp. GXG6511]|uniref:PfkB family carbohydrate kinase n=1 Tax=Granulicoccus sp. GXG6511 TaxID=3381351 RepID=UPI003D7DE38D